MSFTKDMVARFSLTVVGAVILAAPASASPAALPQLAVRVEQSLARRGFNGGWPLGASICPADTVRCFETFASQTNPACCPSGTTCFGRMIDPYCCPTSRCPFPIITYKT